MPFLHSQSHLIALRYLKQTLAARKIITKDSQPRLATTNLATRQGLNPNKHEVHGNHHYANDPKDLGVVGAVVSEDDGVDDTTKIADCADSTREDTFG
jgi:hypothetical protein